MYVCGQVGIPDDVMDDEEDDEEAEEEVNDVSEAHQLPTVTAARARLQVSDVSNAYLLSMNLIVK